MKKTISKTKGSSILILVLLLAVFLSGCGLLDQLPKPPRLKPVEQPAQDAETASEGAQPETSAVGLSATSAEPKYGMMIHLERTVREVFDPAEGTQRILTFAWDSVRVESEQNPDTARRITEEMAALQDRWYTGSGTAPGDSYGYDAMLGAAEDNYSLSQEYGGTTECTATRYVTVLRSDEEVCSFQVITVTDLGNGQRSGNTEEISFRTATGERFSETSDEPPRPAAVSGKIELLELESIPDGRLEIADRVVVGDGGEALLLRVDGEVKDFSLWTVTFTDRFDTEGELFFCGSLRNCAIQLSLLIQDDLPSTMLRYRDATGEHEYLIAQSGENGSYILTENRVSAQG